MKVILSELQPKDNYTDQQKLDIMKTFFNIIEAGNASEEDLDGFLTFAGDSFPWSLVSVSCPLTESFMRKNVNRINWELIKISERVHLSDELLTELQLKGVW